MRVWAWVEPWDTTFRAEAVAAPVMLCGRLTGQGTLLRGEHWVNQGGWKRGICAWFWVILIYPAQWSVLETWSAFFWRVTLLLKYYSKEETGGGRRLPKDVYRANERERLQSLVINSPVVLPLMLVCVVWNSHIKVKEAMKPWFFKKRWKKLL